MRIRNTSTLLVVFLVLSHIMKHDADAQTGSSPSLAAPAGTFLSDIVECGEGYTSHELYDMKIALVEVIRGEKAWQKIHEAGSNNKPPRDEKEYVLARIHFEYRARELPGLCVHRLSPERFTAYSSNGEEYAPAQVTPPEPELRRDLRSGESFEGWIAFEVDKQDKAPLLFYSAGTGGAVQHGGNKWFLLR